jgi:hypothetical protein
MSATYDPLLPTDRDRLRFLLGDIFTEPDSAALLTDEQIQAEIDRWAGDWKTAGAVLAEGLAAQFAQEPDSVSITGIGSFSWRERVDRWIGLAAQFRGQVQKELGDLVSLAPERDDSLLGEYVPGCEIRRGWTRYD